MQYYIELCGNPDYLAVHVDTLITHHVDISNFYSSEYAQDEQKALIDDIFSVQGVESVHFKRYEAVIVRGMLFDREKIGHAVASILHKHIDPQGEITHVTSMPEYESKTDDKEIV